MDAMLHSLRAVTVLAGLAAASGLAADSGEAVYEKRCASCHESADPRVPTREALKKLSAARIVRTLEFGTMLPIASTMVRDEREAVAAFLGQPANDAPPPARAFCAVRTVSFDRDIKDLPSTWNGWSPATSNTRYQPAGRE